MKWFWIPAAFYLVIQVKSVPKTTTPDLFQIKSIEKAETGTKICFSEEIIVRGDVYTLSIYTTTSTNNVQATGQAETKCITFPIELSELSAKKDFELILHSENHQQDYAKGVINDCPTVSSTLKASLGKDPASTEQNDFLLRIEGNNLDTLEIENTPELLIKQQTIIYYKITENHFESKTWYTTQPEKIKVFDKTINVEAEDKDQTVTTATIAIQKDKPDMADINLEISEKGDTDDYDIILSIGSSSEISLCSVKSAALSCEIKRKTNDQTIDIRAMKIDNEKNIAATSSVTVKDRGLELYPLVEDILEGIWTHTFETDKYYEFLRVVDDVEVKSVTVDCTALTQPHCYGYIEIIENENTVKVRPRDGDDFSHTDEIQRVYTNDASLHQDLDVHILHKSWQQNLKSINTKVCFKHANTTENMNFSHYELLLINKNGQWLKQKELENTGEGDLCFTPFTINTDDFDVTKGTRVIISQRGTDGITVLASGATDLF